MTSMIKGTGRNLAVIIGMFAVRLRPSLPVRPCSASEWGCSCWSSACSSWSLPRCCRLVVADDHGAARLRRDHAPYPLSGGRTRFRGKLRRLAYAQSWRDLLHVLVNFILSTITFSLALTWVLVASAA